MKNNPNQEAPAPTPVEKMTKAELVEQVRKLELQLQQMAERNEGERSKLYERINRAEAQQRIHERYLSVMEARAGTGVPF